MAATERADEFGVVDDDKPTRRTVLDFIKSTQAQLKAAEVRIVTLRDPERPEIELVCEVPTDLSEQLDVEERAAKAAKANGAPNEAVITACMTMARWCRQVRVRGQDVTGGDGSAFSDPDLQDALGVSGSGWRAVRQFFIGEGGKFDDAIIVRMTGALNRKAGLTRVDTVIVDDGSDPT